MMQETGSTVDGVQAVIVKGTIKPLNTSLTLIDWIIIGIMFFGIIYFIYRRRHRNNNSYDLHEIKRRIIDE